MPSLAPWIRPRFRDDPFTLGIASGDPLADGVVLWTRLAPDPLAGGGMARANVDVRWEVATDESMRRVVKRGKAVASPDFAHSVHAEVNGLEPDRWYWYRFDVGGAASAIGRTRTLPMRGAVKDRLRFAFASCQHYEQGYYVAHRHLADEPVDFVTFLGDYIYESNTANPVRTHGSGEPKSLEDYRTRYARYKTDGDLQAAHAACPWIVTFDDHEVDNNYVGLIAQDGVSEAEFSLRRAAAYRAYYEHMPLRRASLPKGPDMLLYRSFDFGRLASFHVLDTRQYRSDQACGDGRKPVCEEWGRAERTVMGERQERWLARGLTTGRAQWNVLAQQIMMVPFEVDPSPTEQYNMDS
jgi:alkaline phosphatase D